MWDRLFFLILSGVGLGKIDVEEKKTKKVEWTKNDYSYLSNSINRLIFHTMWSGHKKTCGTEWNKLQNASEVWGKYEFTLLERDYGWRKQIKVVLDIWPPIETRTLIVEQSY